MGGLEPNRTWRRNPWEIPWKAPNRPLSLQFLPPEAIIVRLTTHAPEVQCGVAFVLSPLHTFIAHMGDGDVNARTDFETFIYKRRRCNKTLREAKGKF